MFALHNGAFCVTGNYLSLLHLRISPFDTASTFFLSDVLLKPQLAFPLLQYHSLDVSRCGVNLGSPGGFYFR